MAQHVNDSFQSPQALDLPNACGGVTQASSSPNMAQRRSLASTSPTPAAGGGQAPGCPTHAGVRPLHSPTALLPDGRSGSPFTLPNTTRGGPQAPTPPNAATREPKATTASSTTGSGSPRSTLPNKSRRGLATTPAKKRSWFPWASKLSRTNLPWMWEIVYAIISIAFLITLVVILKAYDNRPLTDWQGAVSLGNYSVNISLNFIVTVLGTIGKAAIAASVEASLSQSKWIWFAQRRRQLLDYKRFDDASRGPIGSIRLMFVTKARDIASLGASIIILSLAFDPFLQLLVTYQGAITDVSVSQVSITRSTFLDAAQEAPLSHDTTSSDGNSFVGIEAGLMQLLNFAFYEGLSTDQEYLIAKPASVCPTTNCTWPVFASVAVCSRCTDVSDHIQSNRVQNQSFPSADGSLFYAPAMNYSIVSVPENISITLVNPAETYNRSTNGYDISLLSIFSTADSLRTLTFGDSQTLIQSVLTLYPDVSFRNGNTSWESTAMYAAECGISFCTTAYQSTVVNGTLNETVISTTSARILDSYQPILDRLNATNSSIDAGGSNVTNLSDPLIGNTSWTPAYRKWHVPRTDFSLEAPSGLPGTFNITQATVDGIIQQASFSWAPSNVSFAQAPDGSYSDVFQDSNGQINTDHIRGNLYTVLNPLASNSSDQITPSQVPSPQPLFDNLALALTNAIRNLGNSSDFQNGTAQIWTTSIQIRWPVLTLPVLVITCTIIFLAITIWRSGHADLQPWKQDSLPAIIAGLEGETRREAAAKLRTEGWKKEAVEKVCRELRVRLSGRKTPELLE